MEILYFTRQFSAVYINFFQQCFLYSNGTCTHTHTQYLATRAFSSHISDGLLVLLQDLRQGNVTSFARNIKY